ncbi:hypothetical protein [Pseudodesulfovibrio sp. S3]|uniref:hypothetical protein n=1 Tax=Pseudodesulfovibrio sp. S3 TaxID=2283629 RepID=UPI001F4FCB95|nr:hypothetical protein [Pseudodesulfovibrio sp. S3]MCJ2163662.1 hypothetical protein [Pseudodesulfovibrio sp. S3-i]
MFGFPDRINEFVVDDTLFAHAYENTPDQKRALLKTCIARLYDCYGPRKDRSVQVSTNWRGGFNTVCRHEPVDFAVLLFDDTLLSSTRLLAGLVPAVACGVENILAVRMGGSAPWPPPVLAGLELAGQELVVDMDAGQWAELMHELCASGHSGVVIDLVEDGNHFSADGCVSGYCPKLSRTAVVWMDEGHLVDLDVLAFAHPDVAFTVYGANLPLPKGNFVYGGDNVQMFLEGIVDVAYAPVSLTEEALKSAKLVLGPGQEECWVWPDLHSEHFQLHRTALTLGA